MHEENVMSNAQCISVYANLLFCLAVAYLQELLVILSTWPTCAHLYLFGIKGCKKHEKHEVVADIMRITFLAMALFISFILPLYINFHYENLNWMLA